MFAKQYSDFLKQKYVKGGPLSSSVLHSPADCLLNPLFGFDGTSMQYPCSCL